MSVMTSTGRGTFLRVRLVLQPEEEDEEQKEQKEQKEQQQQQQQ